MSTTTNQPGKIHYEEIDPNELVIGDNVRDNADQGPEFEELVAVIKEAGQIYQPINAIIGADGSRVVTDGQRRTLAARRLGLATVPVRVLEPVAATDKQRTVERVKEQIITAAYHKDLTAAQKAKGVQELLLADMTPAKVSKTLGFKKEFVTAAAEVAKSNKALAALDEGQLTMEQAMALIEFEEDDQSVEYLKEAATEGQFEHRVSELRQRKAAEAAHAEHAKPFADKGFTVLPYDFRHWQSELDIENVENLFISLDDDDDREVPIATIEGNPHAWAVHISEQECYVDTRTDTVVDENLISWDLDDKPDEEPAEGRIHPKHVQEAERFLPEFYCMDTAAAGVFTWEERIEARRAKNPKAGADAASESGQERSTAEDAARVERRKVLQLNP
ncbi:ParB-like nuclease [Mycobacteroides abscessus subsp. abscessus]|uniref:ParB/RepB/Spo0J family partition protein n=1 Tax=Mycobacteroides abscessus TaxID=36809 RepID=UPI0009C69DF8|nr:ParB/RepB/Spo0J family partition protein [Mycobacteroides abscessus]SLI19519.1 ParB-like nuclease [Mycobacteroides abscessus subsp. abscessus]